MHTQTHIHCVGNVYICVCMYVCIYIYMCVYIYIYIYIYNLCVFKDIGRQTFASLRTSMIIMRDKRALYACVIIMRNHHT